MNILNSNLQDVQINISYILRYFMTLAYLFDLCQSPANLYKVFCLLTHSFEMIGAVLYSKWIYVDWNMYILFSAEDDTSTLGSRKMSHPSYRTASGTLCRHIL